MYYTVCGYQAQHLRHSANWKKEFFFAVCRKLSRIGRTKRAREETCTVRFALSVSSHMLLRFEQRRRCRRRVSLCMPHLAAASGAAWIRRKKKKKYCISTLHSQAQPKEKEENHKVIKFTPRMNAIFSPKWRCACSVVAAIFTFFFFVSLFSVLFCVHTVRKLQCFYFRKRDGHGDENWPASRLVYARKAKTREKKTVGKLNRKEGTSSSR